MTITPAALIEAKFCEVAETTQYTSTGLQTLLDKFTGTNVTAAPAVITVRIVPSGGTAGTANAITYVKTIAPGQAYLFPELIGHILAPGDFISTLGGTASAIVIRASGRQVT